MTTHEIRNQITKIQTSMELTDQNFTYHVSTVIYFLALGWDATLKDLREGRPCIACFPIYNERRIRQLKDREHEWPESLNVRCHQRTNCRLIVVNQDAPTDTAYRGLTNHHRAQNGYREQRWTFCPASNYPSKHPSNKKNLAFESTRNTKQEMGCWNWNSKLWDVTRRMGCRSSANKIPHHPFKNKQ